MAKGMGDGSLTWTESDYCTGNPDVDSKDCIDPNSPIDRATIFRGFDNIDQKWYFYKGKMNSYGGIFIDYRWSNELNKWDLFQRYDHDENDHAIAERDHYPNPVERYVEGPEAHREGINQLLESGLFKTKTEYIKIGDEPDSLLMIVDIRQSMTVDDIKQIKTLFKFMPRQYLRQWFESKISPTLPNISMSADGTVNQVSSLNYMTLYGFTSVSHSRQEYEDIIWDGMIDLFNEANLEHCNAEKIEPWEWEAQKTEMYYVSESESGIKELESRLDSYKADALSKDPEAQRLMTAYSEIPKIGDLGLEISRQFAISELLKAGEYETVQSIIDAYKYAHNTILDQAIVSPIPFDIVSSDGKIVKATPSGQTTT